MRRREFILGGAALSLRAAGIPVRRITSGPKYHWFGYYDKLQFDPDSRYALGIANTFQHRMPTAEDKIEIGYVDLRDGDRWVHLGESHAWSWHQGCMLQWLPGSKTEIIWNDRVDGRFVSHIVDIRSGKRLTLPRPIYCLSPDARFGLVNDFARSFSMRPETGYAGSADAYGGELAPDKSGIWRVDLKTGESKLLLSLADVVRIPWDAGDWSGNKHYFDHILMAPDGKRFAFFQRWGKGVGMGFSTRMFTAGLDGKDVRLIDGSGKSSHYNWRDPQTIVLWTEHPSHGGAFYLIDERTAQYKPLSVEQMKKNGHISYLPNKRWIACDTSPDKDRKQHVYVYDTQTDRKIEIGAFYSPPEFTGVWRCDTTPRVSPDGKSIAFDSPHEGNGRQMYLADISGVAGRV